MSTQSLHERIRERQKLAAELDSLDHRARNVRNKMAEIDTDLSRRFEALAAAIGGAQEPADGALALGSPPLGGNGPLSRIESSRAAWQQIDRHVASILHSHGQPMGPRDILKALQSLGVRVPGKNPVNNLAARLSYEKSPFVKIGGLGWWMKGEIVPRGTQR
jgi:hypothetical protein